jgi:gamma-glutamylcyclotransferase (GGCT)/AIG2-like uncharacterized protein YtfP
VTLRNSEDSRAEDAGCHDAPRAAVRCRLVAVYAAYGSTMDPERMMKWCPHSPAAGTGWITDWRLTFGGEDLGWEGALATLVEEPGGSVFVALYDVTAHDEENLDSWEGADTGLYRKIRLRVHTLEGNVLAWVYVLDAFEGGLPSARYLGVLADAAEKAGAPKDYVTDLRMRPCRKVGP